MRRVRIDRDGVGCRRSFRSWCAGEGIDRDLAEQALAHAVGSQIEQCYARSDVLERRREVMESWGAFLVGGMRGSTFGTEATVLASGQAT